MKGWRTLAGSVMLCALGRGIPVAAQQQDPQTLEAILQRLQANLDRYDASIPSFYCDEHAVSQASPGLSRQNTDNYSVFRLKRVLSHEHAVTLEESREVKKVNGHAPTGDEIEGPDLVNGAFGGGFAMVSLEQQSCMDYTLERRKKNAPDAPYVIRFASVLTPKNIAGCLLQEDGKGRVFVDAETMQIARMELTIPHHTIGAGDGYQAALKGEWRLTVDYARVKLDKEVFWLPATIRSQTISGGGTFQVKEWSFKADYSNFHKLEVRSRILSVMPGDSP
jgi:hypothetical protein